MSRAALLTGRYAIRSGATQPTGITQWEVTIAEALKGIGYSTALFGKWHGWHALDRRTHADRSGIRRVVRHSEYQQRSADHDDAGLQPGDDRGTVHLGTESRRTCHGAKVFDLDSRRTVDPRRRTRAWTSWSAACAPASRSSCSIPSRRSTSQRFRTRTSRARPGPVTSATRWPMWTSTWASCSRHSNDWGSNGTRWCSGAPTMAPRARRPGAARRGRGAASTTR